MSKNQHALATVNFHGNPLTVITTEDGQHLVAMRPICDAIGLQWESQYNRIRRNDVLASTISVMNMVAADGKNREQICLPLAYLNGWLFGVNASRVKPEIREKLITYQRECYQALYDYWNKGAAFNPRAFSVNPTDKLTADEQSTLRELLESAAKELSKGSQAGFMIQGWSKLKSHFKVSYRDIPRKEFTTAVSIVARHISEWRPADKSALPKAEPISNIEPSDNQEHLMKCMQLAIGLASTAQQALFEALVSNDPFDIQYQRFMVSFDYENKPHASPVDQSAMVVPMSRIASIIRDPSSNITPEETIADIAKACMENLHRRAAYRASKERLINKA